MQNLHIRRMLETDLAAVMLIEKAAYPFPWTVDLIRDCMRVGYECWVLTDEQQVQAYSIMSIDTDESSHVLNIAVNPIEQRKGYGKLLMRQLLQAARDKHVKTILLEVRASNKPAIQLYEQLGFNQICTRTSYYPAPQGKREDALVFALEL